MLKNITTSLVARRLSLLTLSLLLLFAACKPKPTAVTEDSSGDVEHRPMIKLGESAFDAQLARKLGADDYGMKSYVMAFLKAGPNRSQDSLEAVRLQRAHMDNIARMAEAGDLVVAGPFLDSGDIRGIYIFDVRTVEEAEELTKTDPAIQAGRLEMELHPWYGSAALMKVNEIHEKIQKEKI